MTTDAFYPAIFPDAFYSRIRHGLIYRFALQSGTKRLTDSESDILPDVDSVSDNPVSGEPFSDQLTSLEFVGDRPLETFPTLAPSLTPVTELWLTIAYISLYGLLFLMVYFQLWMIWYYRHKRLSYQTVFLFICLVWTGLRATLFSFYFNDCMLANNLPMFFNWLLYCFPVCLQFTTLCLLVLFFAQVVFKAKAKYEPSYYKRPLRIGTVLAVAAFSITNLVSAIVVNYQTKKYFSLPITVLIVRVSINDSLFVMAAISLSVCIYKMSRMASAHVVLEAKGTTLCQALTACIILILLFTSRAIYNIIAIAPYTKNKVPSFGYNWVNVSDQADIYDLDKGYAYVSFGIVLFVWEFLPTFIIVVFFRVRKPATSTALTDMASHSSSSRAYFFDNPRRYDSDDDLTRSDLSNRGHFDVNYSYSSINNAEGSARTTPRGTPRSTPWGTPRGHGSFHGGSYGGKIGGYGTPPVNRGVSYESYQNYS